MELRRLRTPGLRLLLVALLCVALPTTARAQRGALRIPADFEEHPALLIGASQLLYHHPNVLLKIATSLDGSAEVLGLVADRDQAARLRRLLRSNGLPLDAVRPVIAPVQTMWVRDYGPVFVEDADGRVGMIDARYGGTERNPDDENVPSELAELWNAPVSETPMWLEGGQILSNGRGLLLVSTALFSKNALQDGLDGKQASARLRRSLPFESARVIQPLQGEPTGHLDIFMAFLDVDLLLVARLDPEIDPVNAARLDGHVEALRGLATAVGPLRIVRVDTPTADDGIWRSYTNTAMAGDVVLVPSYPDLASHYDEDAMELYERAYPDREIVAVDARSLVAKRGALHCVSMPVPMVPRNLGSGAEGGSSQGDAP